MKKRVLILCTGNSCRSQMAEGLWRHYAGDEWEVFSAGLTPVGVHPLAIKAMAEIGVDISRQKSKSLDEFIDEPFDLVVTVCRNVERQCPVFPGARQKEHWPIDDPIVVSGSVEERLREFRRARDEIGARIRDWLEQWP
jgi:arsenate reductase